MPSSIARLNLELHVVREIRERRIDRIRDHNEINLLVRIASDIERFSVIGHRQFFIRHPARNFDNLPYVCADVPRMLYDRPKAVEYGAADGFRPAQWCAFR
jgi:hypothetical protein